MENRKIRVVSKYRLHLGNIVAKTARRMNSVFGEGSSTGKGMNRWFEKIRIGSLGARMSLVENFVQR